MIYAVQFILISIIIYFLFQKFDFQEFKEAISTANLFLISISFIILVVNEALYGLRWYIVARAYKVHYEFWYFIKNGFLIRFLAYTIPLPASDDVYKVILLNIRGTILKKGFIITFLDKVMGLLFIGGILPFSIIKLAEYKLYPVNQLFLFLTLMISFLLFCLYLIKNPKYFTLLLSKLSNSIPLLKKVNNSAEDLHFNRKYFPFHFFVILINNILQPLAILLLFYAFGVPVSYFLLVAILPLLMLFRFLPLSYQGFGLYESALIMLLKVATTLPESLILNVALIHLSFSTLIHFGGVIFLFDKKLRKALFAAIRNRNNKT